jgi:hypothetical protein
MDYTENGLIMNKRQSTRNNIYVPFSEMINQNINIPIYNNYILDIYSFNNINMYGIGCKRAFINKLFTDNELVLKNNFQISKEKFDKNKFSIMILDDNITNIGDVNLVSSKLNEKDPIKWLGKKDYELYKDILSKRHQISDVCISIKELYEILLSKCMTKDNIYVSGILKGIVDNMSYNIQKLSVQKVFKLEDLDIFYFPYFAYCCEDQTFNTLAKKYCIRLDTYKLRYAYFINVDNEDTFDPEVEINYIFDEDYYPNKRGDMDYFHIIDYLWDLKNIYKNNMSINFNSINISIDIYGNSIINVKMTDVNIPSDRAMKRKAAYKLVICLLLKYMEYKELCKAHKYIYCDDILEKINIDVGKVDKLQTMFRQLKQLLLLNDGNIKSIVENKTIPVYMEGILIKEII